MLNAQVKVLISVNMLIIHIKGIDHYVMNKKYRIPVIILEVKTRVFMFRKTQATNATKATAARKFG